MTQTIFITTPCFNAAETIDQTIASIVSQAGDFHIRYHVQDGGSTDATLERLARWERRLNRGELDLFCRGIEFTFTSEKDAGMYDAITRGFRTVDAPGDAWISWINADDLIATGAFALLREIDIQLSAEAISWITGSTSVAWDGLTVGWGDRPVCSDIIAAGLCDGQHWSFIQQEGTFFRQWLWDACTSASPFAGFRLAGDWNLWRIFAERAQIYQIPWATGTFCRREGQLSQKHRSAYMQEIENTVPEQERRARLLALKDRPLKRNVLQTKFADRSIAIYRYGMSLEPWLSKVTAGLAPAAPEPSPPALTVVPDNVVVEPGIVAYNAQWQYPAITEQHAFIKSRQYLPRFESEICYFGFPWATLIDQIQASGKGVDDLRALLRSFTDELVKYKRIITTCQHIYLPRFTELLDEVGVTDVFWSHAVRGQSNLNSKGRIRVHPFPLFPVQAMDGMPASAQRDKYLYSFVGAKANSGYISNSRNHILDYLDSHLSSYVKGRDTWHFEKVVYEHQIHRNQSSSEALIDSEHTDEYRRVLYSSVFCLCPSGSGPNSIRLWESIIAGVIPVVLADSYLPPVDPVLWEEATVTCKETLPEILALPDRLGAMARDDDLLKKKRRALRQIALLYGPEYFVHDIHRLFVQALVENDKERFTSDSQMRPSVENLITMSESLRSPDGLENSRVMRAFMFGCTVRVMTDAAGFRETLEQYGSLQAALNFAISRSDVTTRDSFLRAIELRKLELPAATMQ